jgi:hypothetical protein
MTTTTMGPFNIFPPPRLTVLLDIKKSPRLSDAVNPTAGKSRRAHQVQMLRNDTLT